MKNTEDNIKISVIMPIYNSGIYLEKAIQSIIEQSLKEFELILIDDGSTDGSGKICDKYSLLDKRIITIHQNNNGICFARNTALKIAKGEYIAFCDHDDIYLPDLLEKTYLTAKLNNADLVKFGKEEVNLNGDKITKIKKNSPSYKIYKNNEIKDSFFKLLGSRTLDCVWDGLYKRSFLKENNLYFDSSYKFGGEDLDFNCRLLPKVKRFITINDIFYKHFIRKGFSTSSKFNISKIEAQIKLSNSIIECAKKFRLINIPNIDLAYQLTFTLFNGVSAILSNPRCELSNKEKTSILQNITKVVDIPNWIFKFSFISMYKKYKKYAIPYCLYKYKMYNSIIMLNKLKSLF